MIGCVLKQMYFPFACSSIEQSLKVRLTCLNVLGGFRLMTDVIRLLKCTTLNITLHSLDKQLWGLLCILSKLCRQYNDDETCIDDQGGV